MSKIKKNKQPNKKSIVLVSVLVIIIYIGLSFAFKIWPFHKNVTITSSHIENGLPTKNQTNSKSSNSSTQTDNNNPKVPSQVETNTNTLVPPSGTFVNLYNADANTQMSSICNTTPGASCQIIFTKSSTTIALQAKTSDSSGAATWAWTPNQVGLTSGSWHIVATSRLGSQVKTTDNGSLELVIQ